MNRLCLDNLNLVTSDNLSVIANQIQTLRSALEASQAHLVWDNTTFKLEHECGVFATLNASMSFGYTSNVP